MSSYDFFTDWNNSSYSHSHWIRRTQKERSGGIVVDKCPQPTELRSWKISLRSEVSHSSQYPICEVEDAKSIDDLITSASKAGDFQDCKRAQENPDEKLKETSHHCPREGSIREQITYSEHIAWMVYDFFKISGDNEAILDFRYLSEVQLKNVQAFDTKWCEVSSAAIDRATDNVLVICARCKLKKSEDLKYLLQVCAQETTFGDMTHDYCRLKLMAKRHLDNKIKDSHFKARHRDDERPAIGVPGEGKAKGKGTWDALSDPAAKLTRMKVRVFSDSTLFVGVSNPDPNTIGGCMRTNTDLPNTWNLAAREVQFIWHVLPGASTLNIKKHTQTFLNGRNPHVTTPSSTDISSDGAIIVGTPEERRKQLPFLRCIRKQEEYWQAVYFVFTIEFASGMRLKIKYLHRAQLKRRANWSRTRAIKNAKTSKNAPKSRRFVVATHRESRDADSESFRTGSNCQNGGKLTTLHYQWIWYGRKQLMQRTLRTKKLSTLQIYKRFFNDHVKIGPVTGIGVFTSAETLVIEVLVPSQQPGTSKSWVRISRKKNKTHDNLFPQRLTTKILKPRHHSSQQASGDHEHRIENS